MVAYGSQRTLILKSKGWRYHKGGWEEVFKPISETCTNPEGESSSNWPGKLLFVCFVNRLSTSGHVL